MNLHVTDLADADRTFARLVTVGQTLRDTDGAEVLILGCAGMASYRSELAQHLGIPVVDPCQAATALALGRIGLGY